jgi:hypothetical protein
MKVELRDVKVELEVVDGKAILCVNGQSVPISKEVGVSLIFGDNVRYIPPPPTEVPKPGLVKAKGKAARKSGPQSTAARKKLSESLKAYHAKRRKQKGTPTKKGHLNGASLHVN